MLQAGNRGKAVSAGGSAAALHGGPGQAGGGVQSAGQPRGQDQGAGEPAQGLLHCYLCMSVRHKLHWTHPNGMLHDWTTLCVTTQQEAMLLNGSRSYLQQMYITACPTLGTALSLSDSLSLSSHVTTTQELAIACIQVDLASGCQCLLQA